MPQVLDALPTLYQGLLPEFFRREVPVESKATCAHCAMCTASADVVAPVDGVSRRFRPDTKCCTYHPRLPNYLVGALLADARPALAEGRRRMRDKIAARAGISPQWVRPPAKYTLLYDHARHAFGRAAALRCPYYDPEPGACTIWPYREAVCSTFFCRYVAGEDGRKFWMGLKTYLGLVELQLSRWAVFELLPEYVLTGRDRADAAPVLRTEDLDETPPPAGDHAAAWGAWAGREEAFFVACFERVRALSADAVERLVGFDGTVDLAALERLHAAATAPALPRVLRFNPAATVQWLPDGSVALGAYSELEALALPGEAYALLVEFTGRDPVEAVRRRLREDRHADLSEDVLLALYQHRILVEP